MKVFGVLAIIPTTVLLCISYFVLLSIRKAETQGLKVFGYVVAVLLWISAAIVLSSGLYKMSGGRYLTEHKMMQKMMKSPMMQPPMAPQK